MSRQAISFTTLFLVLMITLACYTATGTAEKSRMTEEGGWIENSIQKVNGTNTEEIETQYSNVRLDTEVTLEVAEGTFTLELLDKNGDVTLTLKATPGNPASGAGHLDTDALGRAKYRVTAEEAKGVNYRFEFTIGSD